ncbi:MAG TPA: response regulator [Verrucomicrobiae bacterium]|nr:response regulator [Verrucomicrobiae bacterium]
MNARGPVLLVEDNPDDVFFMQRAWKTVGVENPLHVAEDGNKAIEYLSGAGKFADRVAHPLPCVMLLDLKLPGPSGLDVLAWMRERKEFTTSVVIVLSTSREPRDIHEAYRLGANAYLVKPTSPAQLGELVSAIKVFWIDNNIVD